MSARLSRALLPALPASVLRPMGNPDLRRTGIVHLGIGAFARAHLAAYTGPLLDAAPEWGILGTSLRSTGTRDALITQDWLYTLVERDRAGEHISIPDALTGILVAPENPMALIAHLTDPKVRVVTMTVTEKGYCRGAGTDHLNEADPGICHDLANPASPRTMPGLIVAALAARRAAGIKPFTILSCDNLTTNGHTTAQIITQFASLRDPDLGRYIKGEVAFPCSMVDRIVPATTAQDRSHIADILNIDDAWPVICEPFQQWVIEDDFPTGRPNWEQTGATFVTDVRPYEDMKLRLVNCSHSAIAYLGQLAGWPNVAAAIANPALAAFIAGLMAECASTLHMPSGVDLAGYCHSILHRFANPALCHLTKQIAMDGSQKLPQRLFAPALDYVRTGARAPSMAFVTAAWLLFLRGKAEDGSALVLDDPRADELRAVALTTTDAPALRAALFALPGLLPPELAASETFAADVSAALTCLMREGVLGALPRWTTRMIQS